MAAAGNSNIEKLEVEVEVQCSPYKFYRMFKHDVKELQTHLPHHYESVEVLEGDGINVGTVKLWKYIQDGKPQYLKERMTVVDDEKKIITHSIFEGDLMKDYKCYDVTLTVTPKGGHGDGSVVKWIFEYEKATKDTPIPANNINFLVWTTKDLNSHLNNRSHSHSVGADNIEKIEVEVEVQSDADKFYRLIKHDVKEIPKGVPHLFEHVEVLEGDGISAGSVKLWKYILEGKHEYCKERMKVVDDEKRMITHSFFEGDVMKDYTYFDVIVTFTPKGGHGQGSVVKLHVEYVRAREDVPIPTNYLDHLIWTTKDMDAHLQKDV